MMTEIKAIESGQKDALLKSANIKKKHLVFSFSVSDCRPPERTKNNGYFTMLYQDGQVIVVPLILLVPFRNHHILRTVCVHATSFGRG